MGKLNPGEDPLGDRVPNMPASAMLPQPRSAPEVQRKEAVTRAVRDQILETQPELDTVIPDIVEEAEIEEAKAKEAPIESPEAKARAQRAKIQAEGRKLAEAQGLYLQKASRGPGWDGPEGAQKALTWAQEQTKQGKQLRHDLFQVLNIDAMQRWGKHYATPYALAKNYTKDEEANLAHIQATIRARPTQAPNRIVEVVDEDGGELAKSHGWAGGTNEETDLWRDNMHQGTTGTAQALAIASRITEDEAIKSHGGGASAADAERHGFLRAARVLSVRGDPYRFTGRSVARNMRVFAHNLPDGTVGFNPKVYEEVFALHWFDYLLRKKGLGTVVSADPDVTAAVREEARELANHDVAEMMNRNRAKGHITVDLDPKGTNEAIVRGEIGLGGNPPIRLLRALGFDNVADYAASAMAPLVAMAHPVVNLSPSGEVSYGESVLDVQTEHPMHWFLRAGLNSAVMAWYLDPDPDMEYGSLQHVQKLRQGYDFTQDAQEMGKRWADNLGVEDNALFDRTTFEKVAGISTAIAMAFIDVDFFSLALMLGKPIKAGAALTKGAAVTSVVTDARKVLGALESSPDVLRNLEKAFNHPLAGNALKAEISIELAKHGVDLRNVTADLARKGVERLGKAEAHTERAVRAADKTAEAAAQKGKAAGEASAEAVWANKKLKAAMEAYTKAAEDLTAAAGKEAAEAGVEVTRLAEALVKADHEAAVAKSSFDALMQSFVHAPRAASKADTRVAVARAVEHLMTQLKKPAGQRGVDEDILQRLEAGLAATGLQASDAQLKGFLRAAVSGDEAIYSRFLVAKPGREGLAKVNIQRILRGEATTKSGKPLEVLADVHNKMIIEGYIKARNLSRVAKKVHKDAERALLKTQSAKPKDLLHDVKKGVQKAGKDAYKAHRAAYEAERAAGKALLEAELKVLRVNQPVLPPLVLLERIVRKVAARQGGALDMYLERVAKGKATSIESLTDLTWETSVAGKLAETPTHTGGGVLGALKERYGPLEEWGASRYSPVVERYLAMGDDTFTLERTAANQLFEAEEAIRIGSFIKRELGEALEGTAMVRAFLDPDMPLLMRKALGGSAASWTGEAARRLAGLKKVLNPSHEMFGLANRRTVDIGRRAIERIDMLRGEIAEMLRLKYSLDDVKDYLTTDRIFPLRDSVTSGNYDTMTLYSKWRATVIAKLATDPDASFPALNAVINAGLPSGVIGTSMVQGIRKDIIKAIQNPASNVPGEQFEELLTLTRDGWGRTSGKTESRHRAIRDLFEGVIAGAAEFDYVHDVQRAFGPLTGEHAYAMNLIISGGERLTQTGKHAELSMAEGYEALELLGASYSTNKMRDTIADVAKADKTMRKWAEAHPGLGFAPGQIIAYLEGKSEKIAKELDSYHNAPTAGDQVLKGFSLWLRLWRRSIVMGLALPKISHFTNTFFGDMSQVVMSRGVMEGGRLMVGGAFTYIPGGGRKFQDALSDRARAGGPLKLLINPHLAGVMRGGNRLIKTANGVFLEREVLQQAHHDGVFDYILRSDLAEATARYKPTGLDRALSDADNWSRQWTDMMADIQARHRMAIYLEDRVNRGLTRMQAKQNVFEAAYDWKHGATAFEMRFLAKVSAFYMFWRGAYTQMGLALLEPMTMPAHKYAARAMVGRTKLARARGMGRVGMALPEWYWWDDKDEILDDAEQLHAWSKRNVNWWMGSRLWFDNMKVSEAEQAYSERQYGRKVTYQTLVLPMLTSMDTLSIVALMAQGTMAASTDNIALSEDAAEVMFEEVMAKLGPLFEFFGEAMVNKAAGRAEYISPKGVPLRKGEEDILRSLGMLDWATSPGPAEEGGRRYVDNEMAEMVTMLIRATAVVGTELPIWAEAYNNPRWEQGAMAGSARMMQNLSGFGKAHTHNPAESESFEVRRLHALFKDLEKKRRRGKTAGFRREEEL